MGTIMEDLGTFKTRILIIFSWSKKIFKFLSFMKKVKETTEALATIEPVAKVGIFKSLSFKIWPKARLTYWLADEEVVVYVDKFHQKDKFKLAFREIISGKIVLVNSANPINYRLEELSPHDTITETLVQQNQRYN
jgi:hypothetical protein